MFQQYPYSLYLKNVVASARDGKGNVLQGSVDYTFLSKCRDDRGRGAKVVNIAGVSTEFSSYILTPAGCPNIKNGAILEIRNEDGTVRMVAQCIKFHPYQLHCRIWV